MSYYYRVGEGRLLRCRTKSEAVEMAQWAVINLSASYAEVYRGPNAEKAVVILRYWQDSEGFQYLTFLKG